MTALKRLLAESKQTGQRVTLHDLAEKLDCSVGWLCDIANGNGVPSPKFARRLSAETGIPFEQFFPENEGV